MITKEFKKRFITSIILLLLLYLMYAYSYILIISLIIISLITWVEFFGLIVKIFNNNSTRDKILRISSKIVSLIYLSLVSFIILKIRLIDNNLEIILIYSVLISINSDIGGLVFGKIFKGRKLTKISPNKTISGTIGSFLFSIFLIPFFFPFFINLNIFYLVIITLLISLTSQVGDLLISFLKRKAKVKDTGDLLPGHGGFLDRIDGLIFAVPLGYLLFNPIYL